MGTFNLVSDGEYLTYSPETGNTSVLVPQPRQAKFVDSAGVLSEAVSGLVRFAVDPLRGHILSLEIQKPDFRERMEQGGVIGYLIMALGVVALLIAVERLVVLFNTAAKVNRQLKSDEARDDNPLGRVLGVAEHNPGMDRETLELKLGEAILQETPKLSRGLLFLKIIAVVAPLMGLLGTVTGMINTFQAITLYGTGDPRMMAGGISQALVTTMQGLMVAIPTVLLHTLVSGRSRHIVHTLQEQSAGIIAEREER